MDVESVLDIRENITALAIAIMREDVFISEDAFNILEGRKRRTFSEASEINKEMKSLSELGLTYKEIGQIFGINDTNICKRIKKARESISQTY